MGKGQKTLFSCFDTPLHSSVEAPGQIKQRRGKGKVEIFKGVRAVRFRDNPIHMRRFRDEQQIGLSFKAAAAGWS